MQFSRRQFVHVVIGGVLSAAIFGALLVWVPYQREQRIARAISANEGSVVFTYAGPKWVPRSAQGWLRFCERIHWIDMNRKNLPWGLVVDLGSLSHLENLFIAKTQITDGGLEHFIGMKSIKWIGLNGTQVTDAGLKHLRWSTALTRLELHQTQTTAEGRDMLRRALPKCEISPNP